MDADLRLPELIKRYRQVTAGHDAYQQQVSLVHIHHSTALDGSTLSLEQTQQWLDKGQKAPDKPLRDHSMIVDYQQAFHQILEMANRKEPMNRPLLQQSASIVSRTTGGPIQTLLGKFDSSKGEFRNQSAMAGSQPFVDAHQLPKVVDQFVKVLNTNLSRCKTIRQVYDLSFITHQQLLFIHPFGDGNGRTARLLMHYVQQFHDLPLCLVNAAQRDAYIQYLQASRRSGDPRPVLTFMYGQLTDFLTQEIDNLMD